MERLSSANGTKKVLSEDTMKAMMIMTGREMCGSRELHRTDVGTELATDAGFP